MRSFFKWQITGGSKEPLWVDNWHPQGVLKVKYSTRFIYEIGSHHIALVSSVLENDEKKWRPLGYKTQKFIQKECQQFQLHGEDRIVWTLTKNGLFSYKSAWEL